MRLLTHNSLKCPVKGLSEGYRPLGLEIIEMNVNESKFNSEFIKKLIPSLDWSGILIVAKAVGLQGMPIMFNEALLMDNAFLCAAHNLLMDIHIVTGTLICTESGKRFSIKNGIPNMMLPENEI